MTDITKLLEEHPLPWTKDPANRRTIWDARNDAFWIDDGHATWESMVVALASALHAERQKNAAPANDSGDVDALRYRVGELEKSHEDHRDRIGSRIVDVLRTFGRHHGLHGERLEAIEKRLDAIANAARGSDE